MRHHIERRDDIVVQELKLSILEAYNADEGGRDITDYEMQDHLLHTLFYFSKKGDFIGFCLQNGFDHTKYTQGEL